MGTIEAIIDRQLRRWELEKSMRVAPSEPERARPPLQPVITVSRQSGSGGSTIAERVAQRFGYELLNRDLIERICASTGSMRRIVESLDEHLKPQVSSWLESLLGMEYVDTSDYVKHLVQIIHSIGQLGGVMVVGRGANLIVGPERGFHVRVVAPHGIRVRRVMARDHVSEKEALHGIETEDHERERFVRKLYKRSIDDPEAYDLVLNTAHLSLETATLLVTQAAMDKFDRLRREAEIGT